MSQKNIDWVRWAAFLSIVGMVIGSLLWINNKAIAYQQVSDTVTHHETELFNHEDRITALEMSNITNSLIINNNFNRMYDQLRWMERRLNNNSTNGIP